MGYANISGIISDDVKSEFKRLCQKQGKSMSKIIEEIIEKYVNDNKNVLEPKELEEPIKELEIRPGILKPKEKEKISISNLISLENIKENENA